MGVGFTSSAPVVNSPLRAVPPSMPADASAGKNQPLPLDRSSFEKLLAAAWVLQCLQDQLRGLQLDREKIAEPVQAQTEMETVNPGLQVDMGPVLQSSPKEADGESDALNYQLAEDETVAALVETRPPVETGALNFDPAVKSQPKTAEPQSLPTEDTAAPPFRPVVLANLANGDDKGLARRGLAFDIRTVLNRVLDAFSHLFPRIRVNLTLRALRALAIATPVWLLSLVAALLFLEVWRHGSFQSAQAVSRSSLSTAQAVVNNATILPATTRPASQEVKRTAKALRRSRELSRLEDSHERITDPATVSVVQQLSRYEIMGLRRQANYGDDSAAFTLGMAYEVGHSVRQNCVEAARWVRTAAEAGDAAAQYNLGLRYRNGDGVPADRAESEKWLRKAAAHRNRQAKLARRMLASR
jgi:Sel1 repeat-containing protein